MPPSRCASAWCWTDASAPRLLDREQRATHGLAWLATYVEAVRQLTAYAERLSEAGTARRDRGADRSHRARRISRPDPGRHSDQPGRDRAAVRSRTVGRRGRRAHDAGGRGADRLGQHGGEPRAARRTDRRRPRRDRRRLRSRRHAGIDPRRDAQVRRQRGDRRRAWLAPHQQLHPARDHRADVRARRVRPDHPRGVRRDGARQGVDVRRLRGAVARLYRRGLARHALGDRRRADPRRRHRGAEGQVAAEDRLRRNPADGGVHRAEHRLRSRFAEDARGARGRRLQGLRQQDLDHASGARRPDDAAGAHQSEASPAIAACRCCSPRSRAATTPIRSRSRA